MSAYPCVVSFTRYFVGGYLSGVTQTESMKFVDWDAACRWAAGVTENPLVDYVVLEMTDLHTGVKEKF